MASSKTSSNSEIISKILECDKELLHKDIGELLSEKMRDFTETLKKSTEKMIEDKMSKYYNGDFSHLEDEIFSMKKDEISEYKKKFIGLYFGNKNIYNLNDNLYTREEKTELKKIFDERLRNDKYFYKYEYNGSNTTYDYLFTRDIIFIIKVENGFKRLEEYYWYENKLPLHINYLIKLGFIHHSLVIIKRGLNLYEEKPYLFCGNSLEFEKTIIEEKSNLAKEREEFEEYKKNYLEDLEKQKKEFEEQKRIYEEEIKIEKEQLRILKEELNKREDDLNHYSIKIERDRETLELEKKNFAEKLEQLEHLEEMREEFTEEKEEFGDYKRKELKLIENKQENIRKKTKLVNDANLKLDEEREKLKLVKLSLNKFKSQLDKERFDLQKEREKFEILKQKEKEIDLDEYFKDTEKENCLIESSDEDIEKHHIKDNSKGKFYLKNNKTI